MPAGFLIGTAAVTGDHIEQDVVQTAWQSALLFCYVITSGSYCACQMTC